MSKEITREQFEYQIGRRIESPSIKARIWMFIKDQEKAHQKEISTLQQEMQKKMEALVGKIKSELQKELKQG